MRESGRPISRWIFKIGSSTVEQSQDSVVTLTGTVSEASHKSLAGETTASVSGIRSFANNLKIIGPNPENRDMKYSFAALFRTLLRVKRSRRVFQNFKNQHGEIS